MDMADDRVRIAFLPVGESKIELVEPTDDTTGVARFLREEGEGFHHVCFEVANLAETLLRLEIDGIELIDTAPRKGAEGPVAFLHPRSCHGVLVELIEAPGGPAWAALGLLSGLSVARIEKNSGSSPLTDGGSRQDLVARPRRGSRASSRRTGTRGATRSGGRRRSGAVTISPRPWSQPYSFGTRHRRVGIGVRAELSNASGVAMLPVRVDESQLTRLDALVLERAGRPGGSR